MFAFTLCDSTLSINFTSSVHQYYCLFAQNSVQCSHLYTTSTASTGEGGFRPLQFGWLDISDSRSFSRYVEVQTPSSTTSVSVTRAPRAIRSRHGIPATLISDNGPQSSSQEFQRFSQECSFTHTTSSPHYPQSNGLMERVVRIVENLLPKSTDPYSALITYRRTPLPWCGYSPAKLLMGRKTRSEIPQHFHPGMVISTRFPKEWSGCEGLPEDCLWQSPSGLPQEALPLEEAVWAHTQDRTDPGSAIWPGNNPRSYIIQTPSGVIRSNQFHLMLRPTPDSTENPPQPEHNTGHDLSTPICNNGHCLEWLHIRTLVLNNYSSVCHAVVLVATIRIVCAHYSNDLLQASPVIPSCKMEQFRMQSSKQSLRCILPLQATFDMLLTFL